jgi:hypothetical protein
MANVNANLTRNYKMTSFKGYAFIENLIILNPY